MSCCSACVLLTESWLRFKIQKTSICANYMMLNWQNGHKDVAALLVDYGAVVDKGDDRHETPLYVAAEVNIWYCFVQISEFVASIAHCDSTTVIEYRMAMKMWHCCWLIAALVLTKPTKNDETPLLVAAMVGLISRDKFAISFSSCSL